MICLLATRKGMSLFCSVPKTTCPLWLNLPAVPAWRLEEPTVWADKGRFQCLRHGSQWRGREQPPFLLSPWWPITGASLLLSFQRCMPSHHLGSQCCNSEILPMFILLSTYQILCSAWSSLVPAYIFSFTTCYYLQLTTLRCSHSRPFTSRLSLTQSSLPGILMSFPSLGKLLHSCHLC